MDGGKLGSVVDSGIGYQKLINTGVPKDNNKTLSIESAYQ